MIAIGFALIILGISVIIKIYKGSKITFAYIMTACTFSYGITFLVRGITLIN